MSDIFTGLVIAGPVALAIWWTVPALIGLAIGSCQGRPVRGLTQGFLLGPIGVVGLWVRPAQAAA